MCNASYLYNYIEICHNSLISFFPASFCAVVRNNCFYSKMKRKKKKKRNSYA